MSVSIGLSHEVVGYLGAHNPPEHPILRRCRAETAAMGDIARMQISAEQGALMQLLAKMAHARTAIEMSIEHDSSAAIDVVIPRAIDLVLRRAAHLAAPPGP